MSSTANRVVKNTGFLYAKMGITMFISLYTTRLILNSLGAADFGIFNIVGGAIAMLGFLNAAMAGATQRFMSYSEGEGNKKKQKSIFNISILLHFFIALAAGIALLIAGYFFFNGILNIPADRIFAAKVVYGSLIVSTMFTVMSVPYDAVLNAHENMKYYAIIGIIESLLKLSVALIVVYTFSDKLIVYGVLMACIPLITLTIMRIYCHKHYTECTIAPKKYWDKTMMKEMTSFAGWNFVISATTMVSNYGMGIILNFFFGTILNAAQGIANQINGQLMVFSTNMMKALAPVIIKNEGRGDREKMLRSSIMGSKTSFFINILFMLPFYVAAPYILKLWLKDIPEYTVIFSRLLILQTLFECFLNSLSQMLAAEGNIGKVSLVSSFHNALYLPLIALLFYLKYPPYSMYTLMIAKTIISISITLYFTKRNCELSSSTFLKDVILRCLFSGSFVYLSLLIIYRYYTESIIGIILLFASSIPLSALSFYYIMLTQSEKVYFKNQIQILFHKINHR